MSHEKGTDHSKQINRLKRIEGQIRGIRSMVENQEYCVKILTQLKASRQALRSLELQILEEHVNHCVHSSMAKGNSQESKKKIAEALDILKKASL